MMDKCNEFDSIYFWSICCFFWIHFETTREMYRMTNHWRRRRRLKPLIIIFGFMSMLKHEKQEEKSKWRVIVFSNDQKSWTIRNKWEQWLVENERLQHLTKQRDIKKSPFNRIKSYLFITWLLLYIICVQMNVVYVWIHFVQTQHSISHLSKRTRPRISFKTH